MTTLGRQSDHDPIVLSFHENVLRLSDVDLLQGPYWLNDQIISFYLEYLEKIVYVDERRFLFVSPEVTQCIKIVPDTEIPVFLDPLNANQRQFIFFPLNDNQMDSAGGSHWSLLVFSRLENTFYHFDSSKGSNKLISSYFVNGVKSSLNAIDANLVNVPCLQQSNGYDCGIHVLCTIDAVTQHIAKTGHVVGVSMIKYSTVQMKRNDILNIIRDLGGRV